MSDRQATVIAILGVILAACGSGAQPTASMQGNAAPTGGPSAMAVVSPTPSMLVATPTPTATPRPTPTAAGARAPPKPTGVKFKARMRCVTDACRRYKHTETVTWESPRTKGVEIRIYGVTECIALPAHPRSGTDGPCLVKGTPLPASVRTLLATAPASAGKVTWTWTESAPGVPDLVPRRRGPRRAGVLRRCRRRVQRVRTLDLQHRGAGRVERAELGVRGHALLRGQPPGVLDGSSSSRAVDTAVARAMPPGLVCPPAHGSPR